MGVSRATVARLEQNERKRTITLSSLDRAAAALDCELIYVLVPRMPLVRMVERQAWIAAESWACEPSGDLVQAEEVVRELLRELPAWIWGDREATEARGA
jgi:transcriptional regulator with XRE-family HTH domain